MSRNESLFPKESTASTYKKTGGSDKVNSGEAGRESPLGNAAPTVLCSNGNGLQKTGSRRLPPIRFYLAMVMVIKAF